MSPLDQKEFSSPHETQTLLKCYIQAAVTYIFLLQENIWQLLGRNTVVCCKDLFTGLVPMTVYTQYSLARSCKLIYPSEVQGEFATVKRVLAERRAHAVRCQTRRPPAATNVLCDSCHCRTEAPGGPWLGCWEGHEVQSSLADNISRMPFRRIYLQIAPTAPCHRQPRAYMSSGWFWKKAWFSNLDNEMTIRFQNIRNRLGQ